MTMTAAFAHSFSVADSGRRPRRRLPSLPSIGASLLPRTWRRTVKAADACGTPPGPIGAAVIKAARRGVRLSQRRLAQRLAIPISTVARWEAGSSPLYCADFGQLCQLAAPLTPADGDEGRFLHRLLLASQCDLLLTGMLRGFEDYAEIPPIDENTADGETTRGLLRWALTGVAPAPYTKHAPAGRLLAEEDVTKIRELALLVEVGAHGPDLKVFGSTLATLTHPGCDPTK
jgi:transcriptional regulator with XRE-family HTH domain